MQGSATPRFRTLLIGVFACFALALAIAGVYGVMAYAVSRRTSEIGVSMAMGAASTDILRLVMAQGLRLAMTGRLAEAGLDEEGQRKIMGGNMIDLFKIPNEVVHKPDVPALVLT